MTEAELEFSDSELLVALARGIRRSQGFALFLCVCDQAHLRHRLMLQAGELFQLGLGLPVLQRPASLLEALLERSTGPDKQALPLFVFGFENWLEAADDDPFYGQLNASRDLWREKLDRAVVFWIDRSIHDRLARLAPDFFSIRSAVYHFAPDRRPPLRAEMRWGFAAAEAELPASDKRRALDKALQQLRGGEREARTVVRAAHLAELAGEPRRALALCMEQGTWASDEPARSHWQLLTLSCWCRCAPETDLPQLAQMLTARISRLGRQPDGEAARALGLLTDAYLQLRWRNPELARERVEGLLAAVPKKDRSLGDLAGQLEHFRAWTWLLQGNLGKAEAGLGEARRKMRAVLGARHPHLDLLDNSLAVLRLEQGRYQEGRELLKAAIQRLTPYYAERSNDLAALWGNRARAEEQLGWSEAAAASRSRADGYRVEVPVPTSGEDLSLSE